MQLSPPALSELQWWRDNAVTLKRDIQHDDSSTSIQSDASTLGWGAVFGTQLFQLAYQFRCTLYMAFNYDLCKRRAISCDLSPSDVM